MNDKTVSVLKNIIKKWVREYNILDGCLELEKNKIAELKAENKCLKQEFEIESLTDKTTGETIYRSNLVNKLKEKLATYGATGICEVCSDKANKLADKYLGYLQEIKAIAKNMCSACKEKNPKYYVSCRYCNYKKLLDLITKAEEE